MESEEVFNQPSDSELLERAQAAMVALGERGLSMPEASDDVVAVETNAQVACEDATPWNASVARILAIHEGWEENGYRYDPSEHPSQGPWRYLDTIELTRFAPSSILLIWGYHELRAYNFRVELTDPQAGMARMVTDPWRIGDKRKAEMEAWMEQYPHNHSNPELQRRLERHAHRFYFGETIQLEGNIGRRASLTLTCARRTTNVHAMAVHLEDWENMTSEVYDAQ